mmetsp:Transcript_79930/g.226095  ORF Transcript_79930/g.226095 Transcript_79930/m.226095 type:complete len:373 (+) Transcript_79930:101-1219(+)
MHASGKRGRSRSAMGARRKAQLQRERLPAPRPSARGLPGLALGPLHSPAATACSVAHGTSTSLRSSLRSSDTEAVVGRLAFALLLDVPLHEQSGDVIAVVAAAVGPSLPTGLCQEAHRLPRTLQPQLLGRQLHGLFVVDELPDAVGGDDRVELVPGLHEELVVLRLLKHALAGRVAEGPRHREAREAGALAVDAEAVGVVLPNLAARGLEPGALLGDLWLVVPGAEDQARVPAVVGRDHRPGVADVGHVHRGALEHEHGARGARRLEVQAVLAAELQQVPLRAQEGLAQRLVPVPAEVLARLQEPGQRLHQPEGDEVPKWPVAVADAVDANTAKVQHEVVVLVRGGVRLRLLALLAEHGHLRGALQPGRPVP